MSRKIILNLAMSLDGYICDKKGGLDWISGDGDKSLNTEGIFNFADFISKTDIIVMGRKAYVDCEIDMFEEKRIIVATSQAMEYKENVEFISTDITTYVEKLSKEDGGNIWLFGGSLLIDVFLKKDIIDEYIIAIIPILLGHGRPLFFEGNPMVKLHLDDYTIDEGTPILKYSRRND